LKTFLEILRAATMCDATVWMPQQSQLQRSAHQHLQYFIITRTHASNIAASSFAHIAVRGFFPCAGGL